MVDYLDAGLVCDYYHQEEVDCDFDYDWLSDGSDKEEEEQ